MDQNTHRSSGLLWLALFVSLGLSSYSVFLVSKMDQVLVTPQTTTNMQVSKNQKESYLKLARSTTYAEGVVVKKTADGLEVEVSLPDVVKIEASREDALPLYNDLVKKTVLLVSVGPETYYPFKTLEDLVVGEKIVVVSAEPIQEGRPVRALYLYNDIPGL